MRHPELRCVRADNPGPFTLDGTRTYIVGRRHPAVIDPGPELESHLRAVASILDGTASLHILLTHGHGDHAAATGPLAERLRRAGCEVEIRGSGTAEAVPLDDGEEIATDAGPLRAVYTPGHTEDHVAFHWPGPAAAFVGDLLLGEGDTTWVAEYRGCVADYLESLERVRALGPATLVPTHGPHLENPGEALDRFRAHREERVEQVARALAERPGAEAGELFGAVYGDAVPDSLRDAALASLEVHVHHVRTAAG